MKITIEPSNSRGVYTAETDAESIDEVIEMLKGLLVACGYHPETVDINIPNESQWFPEKEKDNDKEQIVSKTEPYHHPFLHKEFEYTCKQKTYKDWYINNK